MEFTLEESTESDVSEIPDDDFYLNDGDEWKCALLYEVSRKRGTMYGMLLESIQHFIQEMHGEETWMAILEHAHIKNMVFTTHKRYSDEIMTTLAQSTSAILGDRTQDEYMSFFGQCFVEYFTHYGYDMIMRVSGRHYRDFLNGIDNLHETMRFSYPKMLSPSFYMENEDRKGCLLHYRSKRVGFKYYVIGQLKQCGKKFYSVDVDVRVISETVTEQGCHVVFRLDFNNYGYKPAKDAHTYPGIVEYSHISSSTFFKVFPFSLVFNCNMVITQAGDTLKALFGTKPLVGENIEDRFILRRPQMEFTWQNVMCLQKVIFELESVFVVKRQDCSHRVPCQCGHSEATRTLLLKGQMRYMANLDGMAFLCAPLLSNLEEMQSIGLYIHDLNMYDSSRDMVMAGWQHASRLEYSIEKQIEKSKQIAENLRKLDEWRQRSDNLLYSMIPRQIAVRLKNGEDPINTCEIFDQVTILFSYLIHFNDMCANIAALNLVECINTVFTVFDDVVDKHNVFKVETLGDAVYMVAGGVPDRLPNHAQSVAQVALDLITRVSQISLPPGIIKDLLQIRVGMHTGSVVAGVVGKRMPQYCLFGDTVNTASRMQTYSEPGRIHISEPCQQCLKGTDFVTLFRGRVNIKGKGQMNTYWLAGNKENPNIRQICKDLKQEQTRNLSLQQVLASESFDFRRARKSSELHISFMYEEAVRRERERESTSSGGTVPTSPEFALPPSRRSSIGSRHSSISGGSISQSIPEDDYITFAAKSHDSDLSDSQDSNSLSASVFSGKGRARKRSGNDLLLQSPDHNWQAMQTILQENMVSPAKCPLSSDSPATTVSPCPFSNLFQKIGQDMQERKKEMKKDPVPFPVRTANSDTESSEDPDDLFPRQRLKHPDNLNLNKSHVLNTELHVSSINQGNGPCPLTYGVIPDISIHTADNEPIYAQNCLEPIKEDDIKFSKETMPADNATGNAPGNENNEEAYSRRHDVTPESASSASSRSTSPSPGGKKLSFSGTGDVGNLVMSTLSQLDLLSNHEHKIATKKPSKEHKFSSLLCLPDLFRRLHQSKKSKRSSSPDSGQDTRVPWNSTNDGPSSTASISSMPQQNNCSKESSPVRRSSLQDLETITVLIHDDGAERNGKREEDRLPHNNHNHTTSQATMPSLEANMSSPIDITVSSDRLSDSRRANRELPPSPPSRVSGSPGVSVSGSPAVPFNRYRAFRSNSIAVQAFPCLSPPKGDSTGKLLRCGSASANLESLQVENDSQEQF